MQVLTRDFAFRKENIQVMLDVYPNGDPVEDDPFYSVPTKENMLAAIRWFVSDVREGDSLAFIFCGHMTQILDYTNRSGERIEEALCPIDWDEFDGATPYRLITDRELHQLFGQLPDSGVLLTMVLDASTCSAPLRVPLRRNASYLEREDDNTEVTQAKFNATFDCKPWLSSQHVNAIARRVPYKIWRPLWTSLARALKPSFSPPLQEGCAIFCITACGLGQSALEAWIEGLQQGVLTHCLLQVLEKQQTCSVLEWVQQANKVANDLRAKVIPNMDQHFEVSYGRHAGPDECQMFNPAAALLAKDRSKRRRGQVFLPT
ncbi:unnamed protein product [Durusdinium trenchii]